jgi:outer membrane protein
MMAAIDVVEAEAEVARRSEGVISTEAKRKRAEDELRTLILDTKDPDYWNIQFDLTDNPVFEARKVDIEEAVKTAIEKRTDLQQIRKKLEISTATIHYQRNQILPDLNAQVGYGMIGQGGMKLLYGPGFPPPVAGKVPEGYGTTLARMLGNDYRNWSIAIQFSYPIGDSAAEANLARAKLQVAQLEGQLKNLELQVTTSVREVARNVETYQLSLVSSQATRKLMERRLNAEQEKYSAGLSTNFLVLQAQRDLADARYSELVALLNYNKSLVDIETVLEAPTAGTGVIVTAVTGP